VLGTVKREPEITGVDLLGSEDASSGRVGLTEGFLSLDFVNKGMYLS